MFQKKGMSPVEKDAKESVLQELRKMAEGMMGDKLKGIKKVTVASNDPKGLAAGLEKAKAMIGQHPDEHSGEMDEEALEDPKEEAMETPEQEHAEEMMEEDPKAKHDDIHNMSEQELDAKLQELMHLKNKMKGKM